MSTDNTPSRPQSANAKTPPRYDLTGDNLTNADLMTLWHEAPTGLAWQVQVYRRLIEWWMVFLSPTEFVVMAFILRYTAGMGRKNAQGRGRLSAGFHYKQMARATGLSRATVERAIGRLKELGLITVNNGEKGQSLIITPDLNWMAYEDTLPAADERRALAAKRKPKKASPVSTWANPPLPRGNLHLLEEETPHLFQEETPHLLEEALLEDKEEEEKEDLEDTGLPAAPATRSAGGPISSSNLPISVRARVRQRPGSLPAKEEPPVPAAPLSDPDQALAVARQWTDAAGWKEEERRADERCLAALRRTTSGDMKATERQSSRWRGTDDPGNQAHL